MTKNNIVLAVALYVVSTVLSFGVMTAISKGASSSTEQTSQTTDTQEQGSELGPLLQ